MKEQWQIQKAREICRKLHIRYMIKFEHGVYALYMYSRITTHYIRTCYCLLNYKDSETLEHDIKYYDGLFIC